MIGKCSSSIPDPFKRSPWRFRLSFAPGEAYQFDWSHEVVLIGGTTVTIKVAHLRLCHSRMLFARAYPRETQEMVFDGRTARAASR
jgi:hypothetical protein